MNGIKKYIIALASVVLVGFILWHLDVITIPTIGTVEQPVIVQEQVGGVYSDYPINLQMESTLPNGYVKITHQVTYSDKEGKYRYYYRIQNTGNETILFNWEVLDRSTPSFLELSSKDSHEISFYDSRPPVLGKSQALVLKKSDKDMWRLVDKGVSIGPIPGN